MLGPRVIQHETVSSSASAAAPAPSTTSFGGLNACNDQSKALQDVWFSSYCTCIFFILCLSRSNLVWLFVHVLDACHLHNSSIFFFAWLNHLIYVVLSSKHILFWCVLSSLALAPFLFVSILFIKSLLKKSLILSCLVLSLLYLFFSCICLVPWFRMYMSSKLVLMVFKIIWSHLHQRWRRWTILCMYTVLSCSAEFCFFLCFEVPEQLWKRHQQVPILHRYAAGVP